MKSIQPDEHTLVELLELAESYGVLSFPDAKSSSKPTKKEVSEEINKVLQAVIPDPLYVLQSPKSTNTIQPTKKPEIKFKDLPKNVQRRIQMDILHLRKRVIISINTKAQQQSVREDSTEERDDFKEVAYLTWGNDLIGHTRSKVVFDTEWHVPYGLLINLKSAVGFIEKKVGGTYHTIAVKKYNITELPSLTSDEIADIAKVQRYEKSREQMSYSL